MSIKVTTFQVITSDSRDVWKDSEVLSRQAFPATGNFDLEANAFGRLAVYNDDIVSPGAGFDMHQHDNMEIFTWVADGAIAHRDSTTKPGEETILSRGMASYINAGTGIRHAELNASDFTSRSFLRVIQMWILPDARHTEPSYTTADVSEQLASGRLFLLAGPKADAAPIATVSESARLYVGLLADGTLQAVDLGSHTHLFVVRGSVEVSATAAPTTAIDAAQTAQTVGSATVVEGDQVRVEKSDAETGQMTLTALEPDTEVLVWVMR